MVSLQLQPILALAERFSDKSVQGAAEKVCTFLKSLGADYVVDLRAAEDLSLIEQRKEFLTRYKEGSGSAPLPVLTSACPGWICYSEKTHGSWILPYLSRVRSAQQIMGAYLKSHFARSKEVDPARLYHVTLMPCFDKKLEASRADFADTETGVRDVDLVITTVELEQLMDKKDFDFSNSQRTPLYNAFLSDDDSTELFGHEGSGSGGYAEHVLRWAAEHLREGLEEDGKGIEFKAGRNPDLLEASVGKLHFAVANGFRNIQNLVQKLKRGRRCPYHFVEVMACPAGCLNGGAQLKESSGNGRSPRETAAKLEMRLRELKMRRPEDNPQVLWMYREWLDGEDTDKAKKELYTDYHEVEKMNSSLAIKW